MGRWSRAALLLIPLAFVGLACSQQSTLPVSQAPPIGAGAQMQANAMQAPGGAGVYQWQDVPLNQHVPVVRAVFDQGGYQIFAQSGETIVVPFANQNLYVLKFGQTSGGPYFSNEGNAPVLYLSPGGYVENAAAQGARWYPFAQNYAYTQPVYVGLAPTWADYIGMGWYPGMQYYGGLWGVSPYHPMWMPGFYISIGGSRYSNYNSYRSYYTTHTNYVPLRSVYNNYGVRSTGSFGAGRAASGFRNGGSTGSFGSGRRGFGGGFGSASGSTGSFGGGRSGSAIGGGSFGGRSSGSAFGGGTAGRSSFGGGNSGFSNTPRPSGGSFGGGRSFGGGGSFGGGRSGGSSFGGGRSSAGSFGGGRRR